MECVLDDLAAAGHAVYAVLDDWEIGAIKSRFPGSAAPAALETPAFRSSERVAIKAAVFHVPPGETISGR